MDHFTVVLAQRDPLNGLHSLDQPSEDRRSTTTTGTTKTHGRVRDRADLLELVVLLQAVLTSRARSRAGPGSAIVALTTTTSINSVEERVDCVDLFLCC